MKTGMPIVRVALFSLLAATAAASYAQLPEGVRTAKEGTIVKLSSEATLSQANDQAIVNLYYTETGKDASTVAKNVIERTNAGLEALKGLNVEGAKFESMQLSSWPRYGEAKKGASAMIVGWQVRQSLQVKVKDAAQAAQIAQAAQKYFAFDSVNFTLSREAQQAMQGALTRMAVENVTLKAVEVAKAMGKTAADVRIESLKIGNANGYGAAPRMLRANVMAAKAADSAAMPILEAGDTSVSLDVEASVRIE